MKKLKLYLDTSIINFALADDIPLDDREITRKLCKEINEGKFDGFISEVVLREINDTRDSSKRESLLNFIQTLRLEEILEVNKEVDILTDKYIREEIIPQKYRDDALHIALTTVNNLDILVTWNFQHLVKHKTRAEVAGVNAFLGYKEIDICAPREVIEDV